MVCSMPSFSMQNDFLQTGSTLYISINTTQDHRHYSNRDADISGNAAIPFGCQCDRFALGLVAQSHFIFIDRRLPALRELFICNDLGIALLQISNDDPIFIIIDHAHIS